MGDGDLGSYWESRMGGAMRERGSIWITCLGSNFKNMETKHFGETVAQTVALEVFTQDTVQRPYMNTVHKIVEEYFLS